MLSIATRYIVWERNALLSRRLQERRELRIQKKVSLLEKLMTL